jgi:hypothetical protein
MGLQPRRCSFIRAWGWRALRHRPIPCLGDTFAEEWQDVVGFWVAAEHRLREEQFAVEVYVEDASRSRDDLDNVDCLLPLLENARNQTGGVGQRASGNAVLDPDTMLRGHQSIVVSVGLLSAEVIGREGGPQGLRRGRGSSRAGVG